jgi:tryptophan synthase alpha chain
MSMVIPNGEAPREFLERMIRVAPRMRRLARIAFLTGGYPTMERFTQLLRRTVEAADVVEIGIPFSDPMADGATIQRTSHAALEAGASLAGILDAIEAAEFEGHTPLVLMGYLNPFLQFGLERLVERAATVGVTGFIIPDLPLEESSHLLSLCEAAGLALVPLVSPVTPQDRLEAICATARGFVYAVTVTGVTGGSVASGGDAAAAHTRAAYLDRVRAAAPVPVCAGFGIRSTSDLEPLKGHVDGFIVGSALIEAIDRGDDPANFLESLR